MQIHSSVFKLAVVQLRIKSIFLQKLHMFPLLNNTPVLHYEDNIGLPDGGQPCATIKLVRPSIMRENAC